MVATSKRRMPKEGEATKGRKKKVVPFKKELPPRKERLLLPIFSWIGRRMGKNNIPILSKKHKKQRGGTCMLSSITTMLNYKIRMKSAREGELAPYKFYTPSSRWIYNSRRAISPRRMFRKILRVGLPTNKHRINPGSCKRWRPVEGSMKKFEGDRVNDLYRSLIDERRGGPFVAVFCPDDDFPEYRFPQQKVYHGKYRVKGKSRFRKNRDMINHMVTIVGMGKEIIRTHWSKTRFTDEHKCYYWEFQNSYGPWYRYGKLDTRVILEAFTFSLKWRYPGIKERGC